MWPRLHKGNPRGLSELITSRRTKNSPYTVEYKSVKGSLGILNKKVENVPRYMEENSVSWNKLAARRGFGARALDKRRTYT